MGLLLKSLPEPKACVSFSDQNLLFVFQQVINAIIVINFSQFHWAHQNIIGEMVFKLKNIFSLEMLNNFLLYKTYLKDEAMQMNSGYL